MWSELLPMSMAASLMEAPRGGGHRVILTGLLPILSRHIEAHATIVLGSVAFPRHLRDIRRARPHHPTAEAAHPGRVPPPAQGPGRGRGGDPPAPGGGTAPARRPPPPREETRGQTCAAVPLDPPGPHAGRRG